MPPTPERDALSRRDFAAGLVAASLAGVASGADDNDAEQPANEAPTLSRIDLELALIKRLHPGAPWDENSLRLVKQQLRAHHQRAFRLSLYPLSPDDEPGAIFSIYRSDLPTAPRDAGAPE